MWKINRTVMCYFVSIFACVSPEITYFQNTNNESD